MPNRFDELIAPKDEAVGRKVLTRSYYAGIALVALAALLLGVFGHTTDKRARQDLYAQCVAAADARRLGNKEIRIPLRAFGDRQAKATNALVAFLSSQANPDATPKQKAAFDRFVELFRDQADAAAELKHITIPPIVPCKV